MIEKLIKAIGYPIFPLVPECSYCAAMRWSFITAMWSGLLYGGIRGMLIGVLIGCGMVFGLWLEYKVTHGEDEE